MRIVESLEDRALLSGAGLEASLDAQPDAPQGVTTQGVTTQVETDGTGSIAGTLWDDLNGDGLRGAGEPGLADRTVFLDADNDGALDEGEQFTRTDAEGRYAFGGLTGGTYLVKQVLPEGWAQSAVTAADATTHFVAMTGHQDLVFDDARGLLYVTTDHGVIERIDLESGERLAPFQVGNLLHGADTTPDGQFLYVTEGQPAGETGFVHKIDLDDGSYTYLTYDRASGESGSYDIAIGSHGKGFVTTQFAGSGWTALHELDLGTDTLTARTGAHATVQQNTQIHRSADRSLLFFTESNTTGGPVFTYDAATDTFPQGRDTYSFLSNVASAVSPDGSLIATGLGGLSVMSRDFTAVETLAGVGGGFAFSPSGDRLYAIDRSDPANASVVAFDTQTWRVVHRFRLGEDMDRNTRAFGESVMRVSGDGRFLALATATGVRLFDLVETAGGQSVAVAPGASEGGHDLGSFLATPPELRIGDVTLAEGDAPTAAVELTVTLSRPTARTVTVRYATADDSATVAAGDYVPAEGVLTFAPGEVAKTITVLVAGDAADELDERFLVNLFAVEHASAAVRQGAVTVLNDDDGLRGTIHGTAPPSSVVYIDSNGNGRLDAGELSTTPGDDGAYELTGVPAGTHTVAQSLPPGWTSTAPGGAVTVGGQRFEFPIGAGQVGEAVYDPVRGQLLVTTDRGTVERLDAGLMGLLDPLEVGGWLRGADVTPDGESLYVADGLENVAQGMFRKVDLDDGSVRAITYDLAYGDGAAWDVAVGANGTGLATAQFQVAVPSALYALDTGTDGLTWSAEGSREDVGRSTSIFRSADRARMLLVEANSSNGPLHLYDVSTGAITASIDAGAFLGGVPAAVNRDGSLVALGLNGLTVLDGALNGLPPRPVSGPTRGLVFDPVRDLLYRAGETEVTVYDTDTGAEVLRFPIGGTLDQTAAMAMSDDGGVLFLAAGSTLRAYRLVHDAYRVTVGPDVDTDAVDFAAVRNRLSIEAADADIPEGDAGTTALTFRVTRSGDNSGPTTVAWSVSGEVDAADFGGTLPSGTLTFADGQSEQTITLFAAADALVELDEALTVTLADPSAGTDVVTASAGGTVRNDDTATFAVDGPGVNEADGTMTFAVTLTAAVDSAVRVEWVTRDGTAVAGSDYVAASGTLEFSGAAGETRTVTVSLLADATAEATESVYLHFTDVAAAGRSVLGRTRVVELGRSAPMDFANDVQVVGTTAYVADGPDGLRVLDVSDPANVVEIGSYATLYAYALKVVGSTAYVADNHGGLRVLDVSDPTAVVQLGRYNRNASDAAYSLDVEGTTVFVGNYNGDVTALDVSDPGRMTEIGRLRLGGHVFAIQVEGTTAYVAGYDSGLHMLDVSDPTAMVKLGGVRTRGNAYDVQVVDGLAYVAAFDRGLSIYGVSDPADIVELGSADTPGIARSVQVVGTTAYVADLSGGLRVFDVSDPSAVVEYASLDTRSVTAVQVDGATAHVVGEGRSGGAPGGLSVLSVPAVLARGRIIDRDVAALRVDDPVVVEGAGRVTFTVTLDRPVDTAVEVDYTTGPGSAGADDFTAAAGTLTIPAGRTSATFTVDVRADGLVEENESFTVGLSNLRAFGRGVVIADGAGNGTIVNDDFATIAIADWEIPHTQDAVVGPPLAPDADGLDVDYQARLVDPLAVEAYRLDRQLGVRYAGDYWLDYHGLSATYGRGEKWLQSERGWLIVLPNGEVHTASPTPSAATRLATLDPSYYDDPARLFDDAAPPDEVEAYLLDQILGLQFTGDDWFDFLGLGETWMLGDAGWYYVTPSGGFFQGDGTPVAQLSPAYDDDPSRLYNAEPPTDAVEAYLLDRILNLRFTGDDYFNDRGLNEKWLLSDRRWHYITPDGRLFHGDGTLVAQLSPAYYNAPSRLYDAVDPLADPAGSAATFTTQPDGIHLTIDPADGFRGAFAVEVTAAAGGRTAAETVWVDVTDQPPSLDDLTDLETNSTDPIVFDLPATDPEGEAVTYTAELLAPDPLALAAYRLDRRLNVRFTGNDYADHYGLGEKWLLSDRGWLIVLPDGEVHFATRTPSVSTRLTALDGSYHADLAKLYDATLPEPFRAAALDEALNVRPTGNFWLNFYGLGEKWVRSERGWLIVLPNGELHTAARTPSAATLLETLDPSYYADPSKLYDASPLPSGSGAAVTVSGPRVTVDPADGFTGVLALKVRATAGLHTVEKIVLIEVTAAATPEGIATLFASGDLA